MKINGDVGFVVVGHHEKEVSDLAIMHVKNAHGRTVGPADVQKMMKPL